MSENPAAEKQLLSTLTFSVRWGEMDALGHVNNAQYLRYFEESRVAWTASLGVFLHAQGESMILLKAAVTYKKPVTYPCDVRVDLFAGDVGRTSFNLLNTLTIVGDTAPAAIGEFVIVWFDYIQQKSIPVPASLRALLMGETT